MKLDSKLIYVWGFIWVLIGTLMLYVTESIFSTDKSMVAENLFINISVGLIALGIVALILQLPDWRNYFQDRVKETVIDRTYLNSLSEEELSSLQISTLKAKYKNTDIDREGSFLQYFQKRIEDYIGKPYRENVNTAMVIKEHDSNPDFFVVTDSISYICRKLGSKIQEDVRWLYEHGEFEEIIDIVVILICPNSNQNNCSNSCKDRCIEGRITLTKETLDKDFFSNTEHESGYIVRLKELLPESDKIEVQMSTIYSIRKDRFFTWAMTHPSKNINFTIIYPDAYQIQTFVGGIEPKEYSKNIKSNMYVFNHQGWFLPRTGLAYLLKRKSE